MLTKAQITNVRPAVISTIAVPEFGGDVCVRRMTGADREQFEQAAFGASGKAVSAARMHAIAFAIAACDEQGAKLFTLKDVDELMRLDGRGLERIYYVVASESGLRAKDVEELEKNCVSARTDNSASA